MDDIYRTFIKSARRFLFIIPKAKIFYVQNKDSLASTRAECGTYSYPSVPRLRPDQPVLRGLLTRHSPLQR